MVHRTAGGRPWELQVVCHADSDDAPTLQFDGAQLRSSLRAVEGAHSLDLRVAGRAVAGAFENAAPGGRLSLGTLRCSTGQRALDLVPGSRVACRIELFSSQGQLVQQVRYRVAARAPYLRVDGSRARP
jgi:hypothetical protein